MRAWLGLVLFVGTASADPHDLVDVTTVIPDAVIDMRYATKDNFVGEAVYPKATCKLRRDVAERLAKAATLLRARDRRLLLWDCYRPSSIQKRFWELVPDERYVADPKKGSRHSRGAAVDIGLVAMDGSPVTLPTQFDDFTAAAHRKRALVGTKGREAKQLATAMTSVGFIGLPTEWWHFDAPNASKSALSDLPL